MISPGGTGLDRMEIFLDDSLFLGDHIECQVNSVFINFSPIIFPISRGLNLPAHDHNPDLKFSQKSNIQELI